MESRKRAPCGVPGGAREAPVPDVRPTTPNRFAPTPARRRTAVTARCHVEACCDEPGKCLINRIGGWLNTLLRKEPQLY